MEITTFKKIFFTNEELKNILKKYMELEDMIVDSVNMTLNENGLIVYGEVDGRSIDN